MPAVRLIPIMDGAEFPYATVKQRLAQDARLTPKDFRPMLEAGRRMRWTPEMIEANELLAKRGNCFDFELLSEPYLRGSLFENNVFFSISGSEQAAFTYIEQLATELGVKVFYL